MVLNISRMLTIVFLPVATAMVGSMETDRLQIVIYVGTMLLSSVLMAAMNLVVRRTPATWENGASPGPGGLSASMATGILFGVALLLSTAAPDRIGYLALFVLFLTGPLQAVIERWFDRDHRRPVAGSTS